MKKLLLAVVAVLFGISPVSAQTVTVVTEEAYPFSYLSNGKLEGVGTALVETVLRKAGLDYTINLYPWPRALHMATNEPGVLIYSIARTPEREPQFKWVGEVAPLQYSLYKMRSRKDIQVKTLEDAKKYRIGVVKDDLRAKYLIRHGFELGANLQEVANNGLNVKKLENDRIDLLPISFAALEGMCNTNKTDCTQYEAVFDLDIPVHLYMAFSLTTPDEVVERVRRSYAALRKSGDVRRILPRFWGPEAAK